MPGIAKSFLKTAIKLTFVAGLIFWLVRSGKLDFRQLRVVFDRPEILAFNIILWVAFVAGLGTLRWYLLLRGAGVNVRFSRALRLQLIGFFFNTAMPGSIGGDVLKAYYVVREQDTGLRGASLMSVIFDRIVGLGTLFIMSAIAMSLMSSASYASPELAGLRYFVFGGVLAIAIAWYLARYHSQLVAGWFSTMSSLTGRRLSAVMVRVWELASHYGRRPGILLATVIITFVIQGGVMAFTWYIAGVLNGSAPDVLSFVAIYPIGILVTALPLAPGGLGVGHLAFEKLFALVGTANGANFFNIMILCQLTMNLLGLIPYLLHRVPPGIPDGMSLSDQAPT